MLPSADELAHRHGAFCRKYEVAWRECSRALGEALREAEQLAQGRAEDEPAALIYVLRPRVIGAAWGAFPILEARRLARTAGLLLDLRADDVELENLRLAVLDPRTGVGFEPMRAFIASRARPLHMRSVK